jgi:predicted dehydrogenase
MMAQSKKPITAVIVGAGGRGMTYAAFALEHSDRLKIVGVAEPRPFNRQKMAEIYELPSQNVFSDWKDLAAKPRLADVAIICTQDRMHLDPAVAFASLKYHLLLEKPMAPNEADCVRIVEAVKANHILFGVCHVMRYTRYTQTLKSVLASGAIGEIVSIQHLEPVGYWHQAHSFVRGNWGNSVKSSPMLLSKSCHDLDWLRYVMGTSCKAVSSFGALIHFKKSQKPAQAGKATRCLACAYEHECPYSAKKIYLGRLEHGEAWWPVDVLTPEPTVATVTAALENGPYGLCVYECDNDVVDQQVVNMLFEGDKTAAFTMTAFTKQADRKTRIFGTRGEIYGNGDTIEVYDFLTDQTRLIETEASDGTILGGHGGGDYGLMDRFVGAIADEDASQILSGADESLETHRMVFRAEKARLNNTVEFI